MPIFSILLGLGLLLLTACTDDGHSRSYILSEESEQTDTVHR